MKMTHFAYEHEGVLLPLCTVTSSRSIRDVAEWLITADMRKVTCKKCLHNKGKFHESLRSRKIFN